MREIVEDLVRQFAFKTTKDGQPAYAMGGLSALELAFDVLGWVDPEPAPEGACQRPDCGEWATCGMPTSDGYWRLCSTHAQEEWVAAAQIAEAEEATDGDDR